MSCCRPVRACHATFLRPHPKATHHDDRMTTRTWTLACVIHVLPLPGHTKQWWLWARGHICWCHARKQASRSVRALYEPLGVMEACKRGRERGKEGVSTCSACELKPADVRAAATSADCGRRLRAESGARQHLQTTLLAQRRCLLRIL